MPLKLTKMIYVASSYTFKGPFSINSEKSAQRLKINIQTLRYEDVTKAIGVLQNRYPYAFIGPITQSHHTAKHMANKDTTFKAWKLRDLTYISRSDEVWVYMDRMNAWRESDGVQEELEFALANDIPIRFIHPETYEVRKTKFK